MAERRTIRTVADMVKAFQPLKKEVEKAPNIYSTATNPLLRQIKEVFLNATKDPDMEPELRQAMESPDKFVDTFARNSPIGKERMISGLRHRVSMLEWSDADSQDVVVVHKRGRLQGKNSPPSGPGWTLHKSDDFSDEYIRSEVIHEARKAEPVSGFLGYHATTSRALRGIERRGGIVNSHKLRAEGELQTGEVVGSRMVHDQVYVYHDKIADSYGAPGWFDEHTVVFGIDIDKQRESLAKRGKDFGIWSRSEGYEIGDEVPLDNVKLISVPASKLADAKKWAEKNCPQAQVISREALRLKTGM